MSFHIFHQGNYILFETDPRKEGFAGEVTENVTIDSFAPPEDNNWSDGSDSPAGSLLGVHSQNPAWIKTFSSREEMIRDGYDYPEHSATPPLEFHSWSDYVKAAKSKE